ncbi:MAG: TAXI family TRAP transporter solute-binding subunit [Acidobacteriota bacterium]
MSRTTRHFWLAGIALAVLMLPACGPASQQGGEDAGRRFLSVGTAPPGGAFFVVGGAISEVLDATPGAGWSVTAEATKGSQENIRRLVAGELDLALANSAISYFAVRGDAPWKKKHPVRAVMTLAPNVALFIAPAGGDVHTIRDLAGRRVVVGPAGAGFEAFLGPLLAAHGLTYDDFTPLHNTQAGAVDMLADGSAAAAFLGGAIPTASITQATAGQDVRFVPFDRDAIDQLTARYVFFRPATVPAGTYRGQDEPFSGLDVGSMHLITSADADENLIYALTRALYENRAQVVEKHPAGRAINARNAARNTGIPFHPGAERYYREIGVWPEAAATDS